MCQGEARLKSLNRVGKKEESIRYKGKNFKKRNPSGYDQRGDIRWCIV